MLAAPDMLRTMLLDILPEEYEEEVLDRPEIIDHEQIIAFIKRRLEHKRQKKLAEHARKHGGAMVQSINTPVSAASEVKEPHISPVAQTLPPPVAPPEFAIMRELLNAINDQKSQSRGRPQDRSKKPGSPRTRSTSGPRFAWDPNDCWHSKGKHKREQCTDWIKIIKRIQRH